MDQRRIGGARTIRKSMYRPLGMSAKRWKTLKRKRMLKRGRRGTRSLMGPSFQYGKSNMMNSMVNDNISELFGAKTKGSKISRSKLKSMASKFTRTLKAFKKQEKSKLSKIAEEHNISEKELDDHIDNIIHAKLTELANLPAGTTPAAKKLTDDLHAEATRGLDYGDDALNPDYSTSKQKRIQKRFRNSLKRAFIIQKTFEGDDAYYGKEQGTIAFHEFMQQALIDRIHTERPDLNVDDLAGMFASKIGAISD